jgi:hypothetical protein
MKFTAATLAALASLASAGSNSDERTFAVLRFNGKELVRSRVDPIVTPGKVSAHVHMAMGGSNFGMHATGESLKKSSCTNAKIGGDMSAYWWPALYFQDPVSKMLEPVELFYANVYYFFEGTDDQIKAFPTGLQMVSGNATTRSVLPGGGGGNLDPTKGPISAAQWTCPRPNFNPPSWPAGSDGSVAGIGDPNNKGQGVGFPFHNCDGYASPLRADIHFPSCYNPAAGLTNWKANMAWPSNVGASSHRRQNCPKGWIHVPHIFIEVYWNTPKFASRWTQDAGYQPFVLSNGDVTGFSSHADFLAAWDEDTLQRIIDSCNAGSSGMDKCPDLKYGVLPDSTKCTTTSEVNEDINGPFANLPGNNPLAGWKYGAGTPGAPVPDPPTNPSNPPQNPPTQDPPSNNPPTDPYNPPAQDPPANNPPTGPYDPPTQDPPSAPSPDITTLPPTTTKPPVIQGTKKPDGGACTLKIETVWETVTVTGTTTKTLPGPSPTGNSTATVAGFKYAGCFKDSRDSRSLNGLIRPNLGAMTNEKCITHCKQAGFALAGTEYAGQCYCGNELVGSEKLPESACNMKCEGDATGESICGGGDALSVFSADGEASTSSGYKMRRHVHNHLRHRSNRH